MEAFLGSQCAISFHNIFFDIISGPKRSFAAMVRTVQVDESVQEHADQRMMKRTEAEVCIPQICPQCI